MPINNEVGMLRQPRNDCRRRSPPATNASEKGAFCLVCHEPSSFFPRSVSGRWKLTAEAATRGNGSQECSSFGRSLMAFVLAPISIKAVDRVQVQGVFQSRNVASRTFLSSPELSLNASFLSPDSRRPGTHLRMALVIAVAPEVLGCDGPRVHNISHG
jgi:hypothetical protein